MPGEPGLTMLAPCGVLAAAGTVEIYKLGLWYGLLVLPVHFHVNQVLWVE